MKPLKTVRALALSALFWAAGSECANANISPAAITEPTQSIVDRSQAEQGQREINLAVQQERDAVAKAMCESRPASDPLCYAANAERLGEDQARQLAQTDITEKQHEESVRLVAEERHAATVRHRHQQVLLAREKSESEEAKAKTAVLQAQAAQQEEASTPTIKLAAGSPYTLKSATFSIGGDQSISSVQQTDQQNTFSKIPSHDVGGLSDAGIIGGAATLALAGAATGTMTTFAGGDGTPSAPSTPFTPSDALTPDRHAAIRAGHIPQWLKANAPSFLVGAATGFIGKAFKVAALTALAHTGAPILITALATILLSAAIGGLTKLAIVGFKRGEAGKTARAQENWIWSTFAKGAAFGAMGGAFGSILADIVPHEFASNIFSHSQAVSPTHSILNIQTGGSGIPRHAAQIFQAPQTVQPLPVHVVTQVNHLAIVVPANNVGDLLSADQLHKLPAGIRHLANSSKSEDLVRFCKEASATLINGPHHDAASAKLGASLIKRGLDIAANGNLHNHVVEQMHADMAYMEAWGRNGVAANLHDAVRNAKLAGHVMHNFGARLLQAVGPVPA